MGLRVFRISNRPRDWRTADEGRAPVGLRVVPRGAHRLPLFPCRSGGQGGLAPTRETGIPARRYSSEPEAIWRSPSGCFRADASAYPTVQGLRFRRLEGDRQDEPPEYAILQCRPLLLGALRCLVRTMDRKQLP